MAEGVHSSGFDCESGSEMSVPPPPPKIPNVIANWWLNDNLGSGYSGA
jgi:casein kinase 1